MTRFLKFCCTLNTRRFAKTCPFRFLSNYYGESLDAMLSQFPNHYLPFPMMFLYVSPSVSTISLGDSTDPLNISPVSYFTFCGSRFPAFNFLSFSSAFLCISSTFFLFLSVSLSVIFLSCCLLSFSFDFLCLSSTFSFCFCLFICLVLPSWLSFSFFICVFSIIFLNFLPISFHLPFLLIFLPSFFLFCSFFYSL